MTKTLSLLALLLITGCEPALLEKRTPDASHTATEATRTGNQSSGHENVADDVLEAQGEFAAKVVGIIDGDTVDVLTADKQEIRIRLNGIDAPERGQPFGTKAKDVLADLIGGTDVRVVPVDVDRYGRMVADLYSDDASVNRALVQTGLAWHYVKYAPDDQELADAERAARQAGLNLWSDPRHVPPWDWRKLSKEERDKLR